RGFVPLDFVAMGERQRLCAACDTPSPGPTKRLYYQHRDYGPFFPILEERRRKSNGFLFSAGRVIVCTGCANHLQRQWSAYEQKWTPRERRTYTLLSEEREANKAKKGSISSEGTRASGQQSKGSTPRYLPFKQAASTVASQNKLLKVFSTETSLSDRSLSSNGRVSPSFITEIDTSPFRRAVKRVSKQNTRTLNGSSKIADVFEAAAKEHRYDQEEMKPSSEIVSVLSNGTPPRKKSVALWSLPSEDIRSQVREELQENIEVLIRKLAEIQHMENMRRYEQELKEAAERICRAQDRESDIDRMSRNLKKQLQEELMFRDTSRVLRDNKKEAVVITGNTGSTASEPDPAGVDVATKGLESITVAKTAGAEWRGRVKKGRNKRETIEKKLTPLRTQSETLVSRDIKKEDQPPRSAQDLDAVLRELEQEREWRKRTETAVLRQRGMIEDLRKGIQGDVRRFIDEQNRRYQELKETLVAYETAKTASSPTDRRDQTWIERTPTSSEDKTMRGNKEQPLRPSSWKQKSEDIPSTVNHGNDDDDTDHSDDRTDDDSDDDDDDDDDYNSSPPHTPEFYIH
ncbi:hypothetical protein QZH41_015794, partial [Actinostola sp. cb2023]